MRLVHACLWLGTVAVILVSALSCSEPLSRGPEAASVSDSPKIADDPRAESPEPVAVAATSDAPQASEKWPTAFKRRCFQLGITMSQFKAIRHPDHKEWPGAFPVFSYEDRVCSFDFDAAELYGTWGDVGVIKAHYFHEETPIGMLATHISAVGLMLGRVASDTNFYFYPDTDGGEPILFRIESNGPSDDFAYVAGLYLEAMGEPAAVHTESVQNRMGAMFTNEIVEYINDVSAVRISRFGENLDVFEVEYTLLPVMGRLSDRLQSTKRDEARKL